MATNKSSTDKRRYNYHYKVFFWNLNNPVKNKLENIAHTEDYDAEK